VIRCDYASGQRAALLHSLNEREDIRMARTSVATRQPQHKPALFWTPEKDDLFDRLYRARLRLSVIAERLGTRVSVLENRIKKLGMTRV
jgi:hypothetical protein